MGPLRWGGLSSFAGWWRRTVTIGIVYLGAKVGRKLGIFGLGCKVWFYSGRRWIPVSSDQARDSGSEILEV